MRRAVILISIVLLAGIPARAAEDVPYAERIAPAGTPPASTPRLSDLMLQILQRHAVLWFAGGQNNWGLAQYELEQMKARFIDAALLYRNLPVETVSGVTRPLDELAGAVERKDSAAFQKLFHQITAACNTCHQQASVGFITIKSPSASPFGNLSLAPPKP